MRSAAKTIVCWGEVLWDMFPDGRRLGGAPANVAYHLAALAGAGAGTRVALVTRVGDDEPGEAAVCALAAAGVDTSLVQVDPARPTGRVDVALDRGEPRYRLAPGCAWERIELLPAAADAIEGAAAVCFGALSQRLPGARAALGRALAGAARVGALRVCDPNLRPGHIDHDVVRAALAASDAAKLNDGEARALAARWRLDADAGVAGGDGGDDLDLARRLRAALGARVVAITRGARGCAISTADAAADHPGHPARPDPAGADNVGAGDAFTAALTLGLVRGVPLPVIADAANRYAAHVASRRGATPPIADAVLADPAVAALRA